MSAAPEELRVPAVDSGAVAGVAMLSVREVARTLGISRSFAYELVARREIAAVRIGRRLVVPAAALRAFIADAEARAVGGG